MEIPYVPKEEREHIIRGGEINVYVLFPIMIVCAIILFYLIFAG